MTIRPRYLAAALVAGLAALTTVGCQTQFQVSAARQAEQAFVLRPSDMPSAQEFRSLPSAATAAGEQPVPGGLTTYSQHCASCHGEDGRGGSMADGRLVPDLVTFGAEIIEPFLYQPSDVEDNFPTKLDDPGTDDTTTTDDASATDDASGTEDVAATDDDAKEVNPRRDRYYRASRQLVALQEGRGEYLGRGKKVHTLRNWYEAVSGDDEVARNRMGEAAEVHLSANFEGETPISAQQRWDAVAYLWSLSVDIQVLQGGGKAYQENCNVCHGKEATGDGPEGHTLEPPPRNFQLMEWATDKTNERWVYSIGNGRIGTGMPPWKGVIKEPMMWQIAEYLRTFNYKTTYNWKAKSPY